MRLIRNVISGVFGLIHRGALEHTQHHGVLLLLFSHQDVSDCSATPWTVGHQGPLSMGFSRQGYWSKLPFPSPGDLPNPGTELVSPVLPDSWPLSHLGSLFKFSTQGLKSKHCISAFGFLDHPSPGIEAVVYIVKPQFALSLASAQK